MVNTSESNDTFTSDSFLPSLEEMEDMLAMAGGEFTGPKAVYHTEYMKRLKTGDSKLLAHLESLAIEKGGIENMSPPMQQRLEELRLTNGTRGDVLDMTKGLQGGWFYEE